MRTNATHVLRVPADATDGTTAAVAARSAAKPRRSVGERLDLRLGPEVPDNGVAGRQSRRKDEFLLAVPCKC